MTVSPDLDSRFREAAAAAGLVDVAYDLADSPIGDAARRRRPIAGSAGSRSTAAGPRARLAGRRFGARVLRVPKPVEPVRRELDEYFEGSARSSICPSTSPGPRRSSREVLQRARARPVRRDRRPTARSPRRSAARRPRAPSAPSMNRNPIPIVLPCHRVVGANG